VSRSSDQRLTDILDRISAIGVAEELLLGAEVAENSGLMRTAFDAILYDLLVIGEAVKSLPADIKGRHQDIPWSEIAKMRDILAHIYFNVSGDVVRRTINDPLAALRAVCEAELS
jgi:uncharacterized protein with HEPN domain